MSDATTPGLSDLAGRIVLVTGASSGIGAAVARAFAASGSTVVVHYNTGAAAAEEVVAAIEAAGGHAFAAGADLSVATEAEAFVRRVAETAGGLDVLVNNAGHLLERQPSSSMDDDLYRRLIDVNLTSVVACCRAAVPILRARGGGAIVNTTSVAARNGGGPGGGVYAAIKAAVSTLTRALARELAPDHIRVNAVAPGFIATPLHGRLTSPEALAAATATIPLGRIGTPEDCAGAYLFLASAAMSGYVTGQIIEVNGGQLMP